MNADETKGHLMNLNLRFLSLFIRVYLWLIVF